MNWKAVPQTTGMQKQKRMTGMGKRDTNRMRVMNTRIWVNKRRKIRGWGNDRLMSDDSLAYTAGLSV
jgi:hypothetical protein